MRLALVMIVLATTVAHADNKERRAPCVCAPPIKSAPPTTLIEVRWHQAETRVVAKVFSTGMWTRAYTGYDGKTSTTGGRFDGATFDDIKTRLKSAPWKITRAKARCRELTNEATDYYIGGHKRFTAATCDEGDHVDTIDDKTQKLIDLLGQNIELGQPAEIDEEISVATP